MVKMELMGPMEHKVHKVFKVQQELMVKMELMEFKDQQELMVKMVLMEFKVQQELMVKMELMEFKVQQELMELMELMEHKVYKVFQDPKVFKAQQEQDLVIVAQEQYNI
jgi:hypothetical protein